LRSSVSAKGALVLAQIVDLVRTGRACTRPELEEATGLGRTIVNDRIREGLDLGILAEGGLASSRGGRPSRTVRLRPEAGVLLTACLGAQECLVGLATIDGEIQASAESSIDVADGPGPVLEEVDRLFRRLLRRAERRPVWGIGIGVPGPVEFGTGRVVAPPIMPGWDGFDVRGWFRGRYEAPIWVDNEVNLMALGEWERGSPRDGRDLLYVKVSTGIGSGLVTGGRLHRGNTGAAGDIGHVRVTDDPEAVCRCGKTGCLEAVAGGWALVRSLTRRAESGEVAFLADLLRTNGELKPRHIGEAVVAGDPATRAAVIRAAGVVGNAVAGVVNFANPGTLVLGGGALRTGDVFFDAFRRSVLDGTIELAARGLVIRKASLDFTEGVHGGVALIGQRLFDREALSLWIRNGTPVGSALRLQAVA
jgi:predicted NBD/HSP70 family sugar kinase